MSILQVVAITRWCFQRDFMENFLRYDVFSSNFETWMEEKLDRGRFVEFIFEFLFFYSSFIIAHLTVRR